MWGEPLPTWRKARKQYQCQGEGCAKIIAPGALYLGRTVRHPPHTHLRYCRECGEPVLEQAKGYHCLNGRNDFPDRYQQHISSSQWKSLRRTVIKQRGHRCERCCVEGSSLVLHHKHYRSLGSELPDDVELLCAECHVGADEARVAKGRPKRDYPKGGLMVGESGDHWEEFDRDAIYIPLGDGRYLPLKKKAKS